MLGHDLMLAFPTALGLNTTSTFTEARRLDITEEANVKKTLFQIKPQLVINAAAYTDVDGAETTRNMAKKVNSDAVRYLSKTCADLGARLVHFSTEYVFDGDNPHGYTEDSPTNPINWYGVTKAEGETHIPQLLSNYYIIRTSWLFGKHGRNFVYTILNLARKEGSLRVVNDQIGSPTYSYDLAKAVWHILSEPPGIYHITNQGICSRYDFAKQIIKESGLTEQVEVIPVDSSQFPRPAQRPKCSILKSTKRTSMMRPWKDALREFLSKDRKF
jgi:dTDP-4-dehydrorhamnose reductase